MKFVDGYELGEADIYCECVSTGTKLAASLIFHRRNADKMVELIQTSDCLYRMDLEHSEGWAHVFIYKYPWVEGLLDAIDSRGAPKTAFDNWVNGKLFGYSDVEIAEFCREHEGESRQNEWNVPRERA